MIDKKSLQILKILQNKARIPNVEVSRQVGLAPSAVLERIRKLEKNGIIDGYEVRLNPETFNRSQIAFIQVKVTAGDNEIDTIGESLAAIPEIQEVHYIAGEDGYLIKARVANTNELGKLIRHEITSIKGITSTRTLTVLHSVKETSRFPIR